MMSEQEDALPIGRVLDGRHRIVSEGMIQDIGLAYKAYDVKLDRLAVVLVLDPSFGSGKGGLDRLAQANRAVQDLQQPDIVPFESMGLVAGRPYLARRHVEGESLARMLEWNTVLDVDAAVDIAVRLCEALAPLHRAGLVHGSLSPHSVLVGDDRRVSVIDTGLMPALRPDPAPPGQPWGRAAYLSPEQAAGEHVLPASDVYVIGLLLYEMLAGRQPFHSDEPTNLALRHLCQEPDPLQTLNPRVPPALAQIVHKALAKEPSARYRNAGQLAHILHSQVEIQAELQGELKPGPLTLEPAIRQREDLGPAHQAVPISTAPPPWTRPEDPYDQGVETDDWLYERGGVDWLMIGLIVVALIAVLGLIPLWRTVYRRYALPEPIPTPASYYLPDQGMRLALPRVEGWEQEANTWLGLDDLRFVWYNSRVLDRIWAAAKFGVWESRLRCWGRVVLNCEGNTCSVVSTG
jgi:hypothetical protein